MWSTGLCVTIVLGITVGLVSSHSHTPILHGCRCATREECGDGGGIIKPRLNGSDCDEGLTYCCVIVPTEPPPTPRCGHHEPVAVPGFSYGVGNVALRREFPWLVKILGEDGSYLGSGALIDEYRVLSVAHLFQRRHRMPGSVALGIHAEVIPVAETFIHDDFNEVNLDNDIAVLYLAKKLHLRSLYPEVATICLPRENEFNNGRESCVLSIFGENRHPIVRKTEIPIIPGDICQDRLRDTGKLGRGFLLNPNFLCAGGTKPGQDACEGHGGSPLVCKLDGRYTLAGLVSWGLTRGDCSDQGKYPGAYLNVARYLDWIDKQRLGSQK